MSKAISFQQDIPVRHSVDVFVAGGGPAGCTGAVAAARQGARVYLAEGHSCLGGMGTAGLVPAFMTFGDGVRFLAAGLGEEIYQNLLRAGGAGPINRFAIRAEVLKRVYDTLLEDAHVDFTLHSHLIGVRTDGRRVTHAILWGKSGLFAVEARVFIDGTGDGDLAAWAGAPFEKGDADGNMMPGTLCSLWADVDWDAVRASALKANGEPLSKAFADGIFTVHDLHLPGMWHVGAHVGGGNIGHTFGVDGTDERSLTEALVWGRRMLLEYERYYKEYLQGYEKMELVATGSLLGLRETRRIMGDYVLDLKDFKARAVFEDEIGRYCYPVDIHPSKPNPETYKQFEQEYHKELRYGKGESYGIPYRTLVARELDNVLVAGRCISCDRYIQGSVRVMPGCYITGQAAGVAAALAAGADADARKVSVTELQRRLLAMGAYLPNAQV